MADIAFYLAPPSAVSILFSIARQSDPARTGGVSHFCFRELRVPIPSDSVAACHLFRGNAHLASASVGPRRGRPQAAEVLYP